MSSKKNISYKAAYIAWSVVVLFYFFQYMLRVFPGIMGQQLRADFGMTAEQFSFFGAISIYAYSLLQIPLGIITDRVGIKKVISGSIVLCVIGLYLIIATKIYYFACLGRFLTGIGSACSFMVAIKIVTDYLPAGKRGVLIGATLTFGSIGPIVAGKSFVKSMETHNWRDVLLMIDFLGLVLLLISFFAIPDDNKKPEKFLKSEFKQILSSLKEIVSNKDIIYYSMMSIGLYAPFTVFGDFWCTDFLMRKYHLSLKHASSLTTSLYFGLALGCLLFPYISEKMKKMDVGIKVATLGLVICLSLLLYGHNYSKEILICLLFSIGMFTGGEMICFTAAALYTTPKNSGLTIGVVNTFNMLGTAMLAHLIGFVHDFNWSGSLTNQGLRSYNISETIFALSFLVGIIVICLVMGVLRKGKE